MHTPWPIYYGQNTDLPILMDDVACTGSSGVSIHSCPRRDSGNDCSHSEDVGECVQGLHRSGAWLVWRCSVHAPSTHH